MVLSFIIGFIIGSFLFCCIALSGRASEIEEKEEYKNK